MNTKTNEAMKYIKTDTSGKWVNVGDVANLLDSVYNNIDMEQKDVLLAITRAGLTLVKTQNRFELIKLTDVRGFNSQTKETENV